MKLLKRSIMKTIALIIAVLFCFCSCNNNNSKDLSGNGLINISIPEKINEKILLSEFAESMHIIPLSQDMLIRDIDKLLVDNDNNLYIVDSNGDGIYKFDSKGKFVKQISQKGQGPGEYVSIEDFDIYKDR